MNRARYVWVVFLFTLVGLLAIIPPRSVGAQDGPMLFPEGDIVTISLELVTDTVLPPPFFIRIAPGYSVDVHFPDVFAADNAFPIVAFLQGAGVDKGFYSGFGKELARFGFVVVIPNRSPVGPPFDPFPDEFVILDVLAQMKVEDQNPASDLYVIVDTDRMGLAGHSAGGAASLFAIGRSCQPPFCFGPPIFPLPEEVRGGAFYGTNTFDPFMGVFIPVDTNGIPVALVQGAIDGISTPAEAAATIAVIEGPSEIIEIPDANHYGITNVRNDVIELNIPGAIPDPIPQIPTLGFTQEDSYKQIARETGEFLLEALTVGELIPSEFPVSAKEKLDVDDEVSVNGRRVAKGKTEADSVIEIDASRDTVSQFLPSLVPSAFPENDSNVKIKVEEDSSFVSDTDVFFKEIEIKKNQTASFSGGGPFHIDKLKVKKGAVLNLGAGTYFVNKYEEVEEDSQLTISSTPVTLHIGDRFKVEKKRIVLNAGGSVDGLRVYLHEDAEFKAKEVDFTGLLYGPQSKKIEVEKATVTGAIIISGEVKIKKETAITYTQTDQALVGLTVSIPE